MTQLYSFVALAATDVILEELGLSFAAGRNVFTFLTKDLEAFLERLTIEGIHVLEIHRLEAPKTTLNDLLGGGG